MTTYKQYGYNSKYPDKIETWQWGEKVPEWISDKAKVTFIDGEGNITLESRDINTGGVEIMSSSGTDVFIKLESKSDIVCKDTEDSNNIIVLSPIQLNLLYEPIN